LPVIADPFWGRLPGLLKRRGGKGQQAKEIGKSLGCACVCCHPEQAPFAQRGIWAGRTKASRSLRRNNRAFGSLPYVLRLVGKFSSFEFRDI